jgi:hypothetical protein
MATRRAPALLASAVLPVLLVLGAFGSGCYKPKIQDGGLLCGDGGACPEGFKCRDGKCRNTPPTVCPATNPHVDMICPAQPGSPCDPICQTGCPCGRCNLNGYALDCTIAGTKDTGAICNTTQDDCAPGNVCLNDCDGKIARCYRFCETGSASSPSVCAGQLCDVPVNDPDGGATELSVCEPPVRACNPVGDSGDCGSAALGCYITSNGVTACDCKGAAQLGDPCGPYNSCAAGLRCVFVNGATTCFQTCLVSMPDCAAPKVCKQAPGSPTYGYCDTP